MRKGKKQGILNKRDCKEQRFGASWLLPVCTYHSHVVEQLVPVSCSAAEEEILSTFSSAEEHSIGKWTCVAGVF